MVMARLTVPKPQLMFGVQRLALNVQESIYRTDLLVRDTV
jgi:hypothetical protein